MDAARVWFAGSLPHAPGYPLDIVFWTTELLCHRCNSRLQQERAAAQLADYCCGRITPLV